MAMLRITPLSGEELTSLPLTELSDVKALKQRLHQQHGLPPRFRQRLLHEGNTLDDRVQLDTPMDLQVLILSFEDSQSRQRELADAALSGCVGEARCLLCFEPYLRAEVEDLLQLPVDPDVADESGHTALIWAALKTDHVDIASLLLEAGAQKDLRSTSGRSALMSAAVRGHSHIVRLLLTSGAEKEMRDEDGMTALMLAAQQDHPEIVEILLEAGAEVDFGDDDGWTALMLTAIRGHPQVARLLLQAGAQKDLTESDGRTALMFAAANGRVEVAQLLLEAGAAIELRDSEDRTALMIAEECGHDEVRRVLLAAGAST